MLRWPDFFPEPLQAQVHAVWLDAKAVFEHAKSNRTVPEARRAGRKRAGSFLRSVRRLFSVLGLRERVIAGLAVLAGMRPGEIFALTLSRAQSEFANIQQRVYRGEIDTPKTFKSRRLAALGEGLLDWIRQWMEILPDSGPDGWLFPSERGTTPVAKDNVWREALPPEVERGRIGMGQLPIVKAVPFLAVG